MIIFHKNQIKMTEVFDFNHIDPNMDEKSKNELKDYYQYYHKVWWCYKKTLQRYKKINLGINVFSTALVTTGTIAGAITLNPIILGTITGAGLVLKTISEVKKVTTKIAVLESGVATYEKVLIDLRSYMRGQKFIHDNFIFRMNFIDTEIIDLFSIPLSIRKKYKKKFN